MGDQTRSVSDYVFNIQYPEGTVPYLPLNELTTHLPQPGAAGESVQTGGTR